MKPNPVPERGFPTSEFEARLDRAQRLMRQQQVDALWLTTEPEFRYFSGFLTQFWQSPTRPWFLIVPAEGKPIAVIPEIGAAAVAATWLDDIRTWPAPRPNDDGVSLLLTTLREVVRRNGRVGILMGPETHLRIPLADFENIRGALIGNEVELVDATPIVRQLRLVKFPAEIEKIAHICRLVSVAFAELPNLIAPGETEQEIFRKFKIEILQHGADTEVGMAVARAGVTAASLFHAMWQELKTWDLSGTNVGRMGHGLGMQLTEWPSLTPTDRTVLQPGMVITLEPGLEVVPGQMMVHEENIVIREEGAELLTRRAPRELPVIG